MQIIHLALLRTSSPGDAVVLSQCSDLAQFGFFERPTVRQMLQFFAKTVCGRVSPGQRVSVDQEEMEGYRVHAHVRADGLAATATCDAEYPARAAFSPSWCSRSRVSSCVAATTLASSALSWSFVMRRRPSARYARSSGSSGSSTSRLCPHLPYQEGPALAGACHMRKVVLLLAPHRRSAARARRGRRGRRRAGAVTEAARGSRCG